MSRSVPALDRHDAGLILACVAFLYLNLFANPTTPFLLGGDQTYRWMNAQRLLYGEQMYRDFFQFTPPGADLLYLGAFKLLGPRSWTPNLVVLGLGTALGAMCLYISRSIMPRARAALATSLYVVFVIGQTLDGTHHWFSLLAVLGAVAVLLEGPTTARVAVAGALLGLATFITQTRGPAAAIGIVAWMLREKSGWRRIGVLVVALILAWSALSAYYLATIGWQDLWFSQVTYVRECAVSGLHSLIEGMPPAGLMPKIRWIFAYLLLPAVCLICLWKYWRQGGARFGLLALVATALFAEVAQSPSWFRFFCVALPGVILCVSLSGPWLQRLLWIAVIGLAVQHTWSRHAQYSTIDGLPAGRVAVSGPAAEKLAWLAEHTRPGQFMLQAGWPGLYLPLALRNPVFLDVIPGCSSCTRVAYVDLSIRQLEAKRVQYILWAPRFEGPGYSTPPQFHEFLVARYRLIRRFSDRDEIWERQ